MEDMQSPQETLQQKTETAAPSQPVRSQKKLILALASALLIALGAVGFLLMTKDTQEAAETSTNNQSVEAEDHEHTAEELADPDHHGLGAPDYTKLPLGDNKYATSAKQGYVYSCQSSFNGGGAFAYGPWIDQTNKTWNLKQKIAVDGDVAWTAAFWNATADGSTRTIKSADLPYGHNTGTYPVSSGDDAYQYDRNPNSIKQQTISFQVPKDPALQASPSCVGGEVGIATTGVLIFNAFDAGGRDAVAVEIQDECEGHPQIGGYYHYHGYSSCFKDTPMSDGHSGLMGYSFDGFGIHGLKGEGGKELQSADLDECHGHTHNITWDGAQKEMYHYHFTQDFPYTVSCFRGKASVTKLSSGEGAAQPGGGTQRPPRQ